MNPETEKKDAYSPEELAVLSDQEVVPAEPAEEAEPEPQAEPEPLPQAEQPRATDGTFAPKGASEAEAPIPAPKPRKNVPLSELLEERKSRQQFEKDLQAAREEKAKLEGAFQALSQRFAQPQEQAPKQPTIEEDPVAVLRQTQGQLAEMQRQQQEQQITAQFSNHVRSLAESFKATVPDYADALKFAGEARRKQLAYFGMPPQAIEQQLQRDEFELSAAALQNGRNPAQVIYETAQLWGYRAPQPGMAQTNGAAPAPQANGTGPNLDTIARGQTAARSLGNVGGAAPNTLTGIDRMATMSEKELAALSPEEFRKIMEG